MYKKYDSVKLKLSQTDLDNLKKIIEINTEMWSEKGEDDVFSRNSKLLHTLETYGHVDEETYLFKNEFVMLFWIVYEFAVISYSDWSDLCNSYKEIIDSYKETVEKLRDELEDSLL